MTLIKINIIVLSLILFVFTSCSSGGSSDTPSSESPATINPNKEIITKTGVFIDDVVEGIAYRQDDNEVSYTNEKGEFVYQTNKEIEFLIGDISIGKITKIPSDNNVYIQDLLDINRSVTNNDALINIATFLQSLDSNENNSTIVINRNTFNKFKNNNIIKNINDTNITKILKDNNISKIQKYKVIDHLKKVNEKYSFNIKEKEFLKNLFENKYLWNNDINDKLNENSISSFDNPQDFVNAYIAI